MKICFCKIGQLNKNYKKILIERRLKKKNSLKNFENSKKKKRKGIMSIQRKVKMKMIEKI